MRQENDIIEEIQKLYEEVGGDADRLVRIKIIDYT